MIYIITVFIAFTSLLILSFIFPAVCVFGADVYLENFGRELNPGDPVGIIDDDGEQGPSDGDSVVQIDDVLTEGLVVYLYPDYCDTW